MPHLSQPIKLRVNHLNGRRVEKNIVDALVAAGFIIDEFSGKLSDAIDQSPVEYDCQLVDWRDANAEIAKHFLELAGREPVVALIDDQRAQENSELVKGFSDFVCEQELGLASFTLRVRRLIGG